MEDHAIVIGVDPYHPDAGPPLSGTTNDANAIYQWLISKDGGGLLKKNVHRVGKNVQHKPTLDGLRAATQKLRDLAFAGKEKHRRLFVYASGHGIGLEISAGLRVNTAILTTNAKPGDWENVSLYQLFDFFCASGVFDQVVLLMDCCRTMKQHVTTFGTLVASGFTAGERSAASRDFIGYATRWNNYAKETEQGEHGVFTKAILEAFIHAGSAGSELTGEDVKNYVRARIAGLKQKDINLPLPEWKSASDLDVVFSQAQALPVKVQIVDTKWQSVQRLTFYHNGGSPSFSIELDTPTKEIELPTGLYQMQIGESDLRTLIRVPEDDGIKIK